MNADENFALARLREFNRGRYLACLYLPGDIRSDVAALWAFDAEIARIPDIVSEPMPGEIRLQWWRDLIKSGDNAGSGPLARSLMSVINRHDLPHESFHAYLEARIFDLYQDPMPDAGTFEGYLGETVSVLFHNAALIVGANRTTELADTSGHVGMAVGITGLLTECAKHRSRGQVFIPLSMLEAAKLDRDSWLAPKSDERHSAVISELAGLAGMHLAKARASLDTIPKSARRAFLPLCLVAPELKKCVRAGNTLLTHRKILSPVQQNWALLRAAMREIP